MANRGECGAVSPRTAQRDDEQVRHSRVDAESIATATRFTVVSHITDVATIVITPARQPQGG